MNINDILLEYSEDDLTPDEQTRLAKLQQALSSASQTYARRERTIAGNDEEKNIQNLKKQIGILKGDPRYIKEPKQQKDNFQYEIILNDAIEVDPNANNWNRKRKQNVGNDAVIKVIRQVLNDKSIVGDVKYPDFGTRGGEVDGKTRYTVSAEKTEDNIKVMKVMLSMLRKLDDVSVTRTK